MSERGALALVFFTSAAVLVMEILAGRLMAPFVGVTLETFTGIIGTVLAAIALGSWAGGRASDRRDPADFLGGLIVVGGIAVLLSPTVIAAMGPTLTGGGPLEIVVLTTLGFFLPAVLLSAVSPAVVKLRLSSLEETGAVVGRYSAAGTAGALFGTFVTGFVLVATLPSRMVLLVVGVALIAVGAFLMARRGALRAAALNITIPGLLVAGLLFAVPGPCDEETTYFCARVEVDPNRSTGRAVWLDTLRHSYVDVADPTHLEFRYAKIFGDVLTVQPPPGPVSTLSVGGGAMSLPRYVAATRPGSTATILELDEALVDITRDLGVEPDGEFTVLVGDARLTLASTAPDSFDVVFGDAFGGPAVPWHLTTREFLEEVEERLTDDGFYIMNMIDYGPRNFAKAELATIDAVFEHVAVIAPQTYLDGINGGNFVLIGSNVPIVGGAIGDLLVARQASSVVLTDGDARAWFAGARVLTDDFAPVDQLITPAG